MAFARPKRAGEQFTRTRRAVEDHETAGPSSSKKPRFDLRNPSALAPDALEEDAVLDADEIGRRGQGVRRKAVNLDGFESDSENERFKVRTEVKISASRRQQADDDDDDDMFAGSQDEIDAADVMDGGLRKKNTVRFLQDDEIEGQIASSRGGRSLHADLSRPNAKGVEGGSDSESDVPDEERARINAGMDEELGAGAKKTHAPLLDAFNMRAEQEEGRFDDQGNYVRKAVDPDAIHDTWLAGVSKKDIKRAREAAEKRDAERRQRDREEDGILTADLLNTIITHLERGETVLEALARLGRGLRKKSKWQTKHKKKARSKANQNGTEDIEMAEGDSTEESTRRQAIETVTGAADLLLTRGQLDIYDIERETLTRQYRRETGEEWVDPSAAAETSSSPAAATTTGWEYRWSDARDGGETHGPYDGSMMQSWSDAGYFGDSVEFRRAGDTGGWSRTVQFT
jgi:CD2 antigen cytoplasmic tail-binding protein 2